MIETDTITTKAASAEPILVDADALGPLAEDKNVQWVYIGPVESWKARFSLQKLKRVALALLSLEGLWRLVEAFDALQEINLDVQKRAQDDFNTVTIYHKATRSRVVLRGDGNIDVHANRHLHMKAVVLLEQCSDEADADPMTRLFGVKPKVEVADHDPTIPCS